MALSSQVNMVFYELEQFERRVNQERATSPKFEAEVQRLRYEVHRLHWEANNLDEAVRVARFREMYNPNVQDLTRQIYIVRHEIGFMKSQLTAFTHLDKHPPKRSTIFSSPSESPSNSPEGAGTSSVYWFSPQRNGSSQHIRRNNNWGWSS